MKEMMDMKVLLLADEADPLYWEYLKKERLEDIKLILACGDLPASYLSYLTCFTHAPIVYVPGNHDTRYADQPPEGCICADENIVKVCGLRILGLGGSMRYKPGPFQYTEREMEKRIARLRWKLRFSRGFDILITHAPMRGLGDMDDLPHRGFECFAPLLQKYRPMLFAFAHVHAAYMGGRFQRNFDYDGLLCVNAWKSHVIELPGPPAREEAQRAGQT